MSNFTLTIYQVSLIYSSFWRFGSRIFNLKVVCNGPTEHCHFHPRPSKNLKKYWEALLKLCKIISQLLVPRNNAIFLWVLNIDLLNNRSSGCISWLHLFFLKPEDSLKTGYFKALYTAKPKYDSETNGISFKISKTKDRVQKGK